MVELVMAEMRIGLTLCETVIRSLLISHLLLEG